MKKILALTGETGAGKDTFCEYAQKTFPLTFSFRFSDPLFEVLKIFFEEIKKQDQQWLATALRARFGNNILGEVIIKKIKKINEGLIIVNGIRMLEELELVKRLGGKIVYITAVPKIRWQRIQKRGEKKDDNVSFEKFLEIEEAPTEILISQVGQKADFKIENNGSKESFYQKVEKIINKL